jgi:putative cell wall-binding protein
MRVVGAVAATLAVLASVAIGVPSSVGSVLAAARPSGAAAAAATPAPTPQPTTGQGTLTRVAGADRIATSVRISQVGFPNKLSATAVVLARADDFADELAGGPLAARFQGPLLLTPTAGLTDAVRAEIQRVLAVGHTVYLLGGTDAISANVGTDLQTLGYTPVRVDGIDRYDTAVKIANILGDPPTVFEVDGTNFPDGLSAGPAAALSHGVILLTAGNVQAPETAQYIATHPTDVRYAIGGPAAAADPTAQPLVGADRYATSIVVANQLFASPSIVAIASGVAFPDALSGGALAGIDGAPMLLVPSNVPLPASMQSYFNRYSNTVLSAWLFGGTAAVSTPVAKAIAQALVLVPSAS